MKEIDPFVNDSLLRYLNLNWLYTRLYENDWFYIDYWSFVHCWSGFLLFLFLLRLNIKFKWVTLILLLISYEGIEIVLRFMRINIFNSEVFTDTSTDLCVGMIGGVIAQIIYIRKRKFYKRELNFWEPCFLTSISLAFVISGFYNFSSNITALENGERQPIIFVHWVLIIFSLLFIFRLLRRYISPIIALLYLYILYFSVYFAIHILWPQYFEYWQPFSPAFYGITIGNSFQIHFIDWIVPTAVHILNAAYMKYFIFIYQIKPLTKNLISSQFETIKKAV